MRAFQRFTRIYKSIKTFSRYTFLGPRYCINKVPTASCKSFSGDDVDWFGYCMLIYLIICTAIGWSQMIRRALYQRRITSSLHHCLKKIRSLQSKTRSSPATQSWYKWMSIFLNKFVLMTSAHARKGPVVRWRYWASETACTSRTSFPNCRNLAFFIQISAWAGTWGKHFGKIRISSYVLLNFNWF